MQGGVETPVGVATVPVEIRCYEVAQRQRGRVRCGDVDDGGRPFALVRVDDPHGDAVGPMQPAGIAGLAAAARSEHRAVRFDAARPPPPSPQANPISTRLKPGYDEQPDRKLS